MKRSLTLTIFAIMALAISDDAFAQREGSPIQQTAVYENLRSRDYLKNWLICGPFPIDIATLSMEESTRKALQADENFENTPLQKAAFDYDFLVDFGGETEIVPTEDTTHSFQGETYAWKLHNNRWRKINLGQVYSDWGVPERPVGYFEDVMTYAYCEIETPKERPGYLGIGSDDGIKIWLNGELAHEHFVGRQCSSDDDIVDVTFRAGTNRMLLKIQNMSRDYEFICRYYDADDSPLVNIAGNMVHFGRDSPRSMFLIIAVFGGAFLVFALIALVATLQKKFDL